MNAKPKENTVPSLEVIINDAKTDAYNQHISNRLESLRGWTAGDEWAKGFHAYHSAALAQLLRHLIHGCKTRDEDQFLRGKIAAMEEVIGFRDMILRQIEAVERNKDRGPKGDAGY